MTKVKTNFEEDDVLPVADRATLILPTGELKIFEPGMVPTEDGAPRFDWLREQIGCEWIEHVTVWYGWRVAHMFVDENGHFAKRPFNKKASAVYGNLSLHNAGVDRLMYFDVAKPAPPDAQLQAVGAIIVGPAVLWEGRWE